MKTVLTRSGRVRCFIAAFAASTWLVGGAFSSFAYTTAHFAAIQTQITNDLSALAAIATPTKEDRALLKSLQRASNTLTHLVWKDGKTLRSLNTILGRVPAYETPLVGIQSNLLAGFNAENTFVADLITQLPQSPAAESVARQYAKFGGTATRLNSASALTRFSALYDTAKGRLDALFATANEAMVIPFPSDLPPNSVFATINGVSFRVNASLGTENKFEAIATETNISLVLSAVTTGKSSRGLLFSVPNVQFGAFGYSIPAEASLTNRTGIYPPGAEPEVNVGATNGAIFINTTTTEVYGSFSSTAPGFTTTDGRFRITITRP